MKSYKGKRLSGWLKGLIALLLVGATVFFILLGIVLRGSHDRIQGEPQVMIVLGCKVMPWGASILLCDRLDRALDYLEEHPRMTVVVSGGQGPDEHISEAQCMYEYLTAAGVDAQQILLEDQSASTLQNLRCSLQLLEEQGYDITDGVAVVSNGFHLTRVRMLWDRVCGDDGDLSTLAAPSSHVPSRLKMYVREPLALAKSYILDH